MTICAQQPKVSDVRIPISEPTTPRPARLKLLDLSLAVDVVNVERAEVVKPARDALASERLDNGELSFPVSRRFVNASAVLVPVRSAAVGRAETVPTLFAAIRARLVRAPSRRQVALLPAIMARAFGKPRGVHLVGLAAVGAVGGNRWFSHAVKVAHDRREPKYFDIACKRIDEAYRQPRLFKDEAPKAKQEALL